MPEQTKELEQFANTGVLVPRKTPEKPDKKASPFIEYLKKQYLMDIAGVLFLAIIFLMILSMCIVFLYRLFNGYAS